MNRGKLSSIIIVAALMVGIAGCSGAKSSDSAKYDSGVATLESYVDKNDNIGAVFPNLYCVGDQYAVVASYFGMYVVDVQKAQVVDYVDLVKYGCNQFQGDQIATITADAENIYFFKTENEKISGKIYELKVSDGTVEEIAEDEYNKVQLTDTRVTTDWESFVSAQGEGLADKLKDYETVDKSEVLDMGSCKVFTVAEDWKLSNFKIVLVNSATEDVQEIEVK